MSRSYLSGSPLPAELLFFGRWVVCDGADDGCSRVLMVVVVVVMVVVVVVWLTVLILIG